MNPRPDRSDRRLAWHAPLEHRPSELSARASDSTGLCPRLWFCVFRSQAIVDLRRLRGMETFCAARSSISCHVLVKQASSALMALPGMALRRSSALAHHMGSRQQELIYKLLSRMSQRYYRVGVASKSIDPYFPASDVHDCAGLRWTYGLTTAVPIQTMWSDMPGCGNFGKRVNSCQS